MAAYLLRNSGNFRSDAHHCRTVPDFIMGIQNQINLQPLPPTPTLYTDLFWSPLYLFPYTPRQRFNQWEK